MKEIRLMEVGPRDGLQNEKSWVSTKDKIDFIDDLSKAGCKRIEITAFVSPKWIPPLSDHIEVAKGIKKRPGVSYAALIPNMTGYERALSCGLNEISLVISATNTHNQKNLNGTTDEVFLRCKEVAKKARLDNLPFRIYLSCTFGCPYEGRVSLEKIAEMSKRLLDLGAYEIALSDTIGVASPNQTKEVLLEVLKVIPLKNIALHFHDTQGLALANIYAALCLEVGSFDSSIGGLGGCPYAHGASGNVASEDLVNMLNKMGINTSVDLEKMLDISFKMEQILQKELPAKLLAIKRASNKREKD